MLGDGTIMRYLYKLMAGLVVLSLCVAGVSLAESSYEKLQPGQTLNGFSVENLYLNGKDQAFGARFVHLKTGYTIDLFDIQSVPQAFLWVNSPPESDMGEAHTCEHILLGKGNKGRSVASLESMSLGQSTAYTSQLYTAFPFTTDGGNEAFYKLFDAQLDALLHPDFSDEEIRREVCHVGVEANPETGRLQLDEKGTVYTEMVSSFEKYDYLLIRTLNEMVYGPDHPLANISGGDPAAIRKMQASDMRAFIAKRYRLNNLGAIVTIPQDVTTSDFLTRIGVTLNRVQGPETSGNIPPAVIKLPPPQPTATTGTIEMTTYPGANAKEPGNIVFCWPATLEFDGGERMLLNLFLDCFGGSQTSNLYDKFINSQTRVVDLGASGVWAGVNDQLGHPIGVGISDVKVDLVTPAEIASLSKMIRDEAAAIAAYASESPELKAFNDRAKGRLEEMRKSMAEYLNSPPGFGLRNGSGDGWYSLIKLLEDKKGFRKSLLLKDDMDYAATELNQTANIWAPLIAKWKLASVEPYAAGCVADPAMIAAATEEKKARLAAFTDSLKTAYGLSDEQAALARYKTEFDQNTARIDAEAAKVPIPKFLDNPPLTYDPQLDYAIDTIAGVMPLVASTFNSMTSATMAVIFNLNVVPPDKLLYLPLLPLLITEVGVLKNGQPIDYAVMSERLKKEVLNLRGEIVANPYTDRVELMITGAGSNPEESQRALEWMTDGLLHPYLAIDNLPRLRDVVNNRLALLRNTTKGMEEYWVQYPATAYLFQTNRLILAGNCFMTQEHFMQRLKWRLQQAPQAPARSEVDHLFDLLASAADGQSKESLTAFAAGIGGLDTAKIVPAPLASFAAAYKAAAPEAQTIIKEAASDLAAILATIPAENAAGDWAYLSRQMKSDLGYSPEKTVDDVKEILKLVCQQKNVRGYVVSSADDRARLLPFLSTLVSQLAAGPMPMRYDHTGGQVVLERLRSRHPGLERPRYVGLINDDTRNGVFINSAACAGIFDTTRERILDFLAAKLYGGQGSHSMHMKTWTAGLAYSNGLRSGETSGRLVYYAERCPDIAATMRFVVGELNKSPYDPQLAEYAIAQSFSGGRGSTGYVSRGMAMAANLADGYSPERVAAFRQRILAQRSLPDLYDRLHSRMKRVYATVLIGLGEKTGSSPTNYFIVGPEAQFRSLEEYIASVESPQPVYRLYPRDYWLTD